MAILELIDIRLSKHKVFLMQTWDVTRQGQSYMGMISRVTLLLPLTTRAGRMELGPKAGQAGSRVPSTCTALSCRHGYVTRRPMLCSAGLPHP